MVNIKSLIYEIREQQVMLDSDLAQMYGIETKALNRAVKRNIDKFPPEFMFQLDETEYKNLRYQIGTSSYDYDEKNGKFHPSLRSQSVTSKGGRRYMPYAFTEHGVIMLASVLNSPIAIKMNIAIVKSFIDMRRYIAQPVGKKLEDIEKVLMLHIDDTNLNFAGHAATINEIINRLNNMIEHPRKKNKIGFIQGDDK